VTLRRFFETPKGVLLLLLVALAAVGSWLEGWERALPGLATASLVAVAIDGAILRVRKGRWVFPSGALLSALIVAMILTPDEPWLVPAITTAIAVTSKYVCRVGTANVFNPAALALVIGFYAFDSAHNWWGALPETPVGPLLLLATGVFITARVDKIPLVLSFLGCWFLLDTATAFVGFPERVAELFRSPDLEAALFFAFFMVTDPPTSPPKHGDQLLYGVTVAVVSYATFTFIGGAYYLLAGLLVANVWEAVRRSRARSLHRRQAPTWAAMPTR
jgi:Na+-translocating ferredoxin:NAD+ oxidoreductase RnfD subunit